MIINSLCGCLCAYGLAGLRLSAHAVLLNLCITALQSMISIQLQACRPQTRSFFALLRMGWTAVKGSLLHCYRATCIVCALVSK